MFHLLVLLVIIACNSKYGVFAVTLDASLLSQRGYNNESWYIQISYSNIDGIDPNAFKEYTKVIGLDLQSNQLSKVDIGLFKDIVNLTTIDLSYNPLTQITNSKKIVFSIMRNLRLYECPLSSSFDSNVTKCNVTRSRI